MGKTVVVDSLPKCDFCGNEAHYDGKTTAHGVWAYMCEKHFRQYRVGLGTGKGQKLIVAPFKCPHCGAMMTPEGQLDATGISSVCLECGAELDFENLPEAAVA